MLDIIPILIASTIIALISYMAGRYFHHNIYLNGLVVLVVYTVIYASWSFVFKPEAYCYFEKLVNPYILTIKEKFIKWKS